MFQSPTFTAQTKSPSCTSSFTKEKNPSTNPSAKSIAESTATMRLWQCASGKHSRDIMGFVLHILCKRITKINRCFDSYLFCQLIPFRRHQHQQQPQTHTNFIKMVQQNEQEMICSSTEVGLGLGDEPEGTNRRAVAHSAKYLHQSTLKNSKCMCKCIWKSRCCFKDKGCSHQTSQFHFWCLHLLHWTFMIWSIYRLNCQRYHKASYILYIMYVEMSQSFIYTVYNVRRGITKLYMYCI